MISAFISTSYEYYGYAPDNERVWKKRPNGTEANARFALEGVKNAKLDSDKCQKDLNLLGLSAAQINSAAGKQSVTATNLTDPMIKGEGNARTQIGSTTTELFIEQWISSYAPPALVVPSGAGPSMRIGVTQNPEAEGTMMHELLPALGFINTVIRDKFKEDSVYQTAYMTLGSRATSIKFANDCFGRK
jgi:hypothetical protein